MCWNALAVAWPNTVFCFNFEFFPAPNLFDCCICTWFVHFAWTERWFNCQQGVNACQSCTYCYLLIDIILHLARVMFHLILTCFFCLFALAKSTVRGECKFTLNWAWFLFYDLLFPLFVRLKHQQKWVSANSHCTGLISRNWCTSIFQNLRLKYQQSYVSASSPCTLINICLP
jgi:hypothetical protein